MKVHLAPTAASPACLSDEQIEAALNELGSDAAAVLELSDWRTAAGNVTVAYVLGLEEN